MVKLLVVSVEKDLINPWHIVGEKGEIWGRFPEEYLAEKNRAKFEGVKDVD